MKIPDEFKSKEFRAIMLKHATIAILRGVRFRGRSREFPADLYGDDVHALADDIVQETFVKLEANKEHEAIKSWTAFILSAITIQVMNVRRKILRHPSPVPISGIDPSSSDSEIPWVDLEIPDSSSASPEQILIEKEQWLVQQKKITEASKQLKQRYSDHLAAKDSNLAAVKHVIRECVKSGRIRSPEQAESFIEIMRQYFDDPVEGFDTIRQRVESSGRSTPSKANAQRWWDLVRLNLPMCMDDIAREHAVLSELQEFFND
jgi:DNA-directed RNA polymerase specialized sigma24 family protein